MAKLPTTYDADSVQRAIDRKVGFDLGNATNPVVVVVSPVAPDTEFSVAHNLGRIPKGWHIISQNAPGSLYRGDKSADTEKVYFKCSGVKVSLSIIFL